VINVVQVETGDLICMVDGGLSTIEGPFWWNVVRKLILGDVDHIEVCVSADRRCIEAGATREVLEFDVPGEMWDAQEIHHQRGFVDQIYGVAYPVRDVPNLDESDIANMRAKVAEYCYVQVGKPYNLNSLDSDTEEVVSLDQT
jgi:hypothetical protein